MRRSRFLVPVWGGLLAATLGQGQPSAWAQQDAPPPKAAADQPATDLSTRFKFQERYSVDDKASSEAVGQCRVAIRQTIKSSEERPQGSPRRDEVTAQAIFVERPAVVADNGTVTATVRRYETYRLTPDPERRPSSLRPFEGITLWYQPRLRQGPLILSLTDGRVLRESEYAYASRQIFLPDLVSILPSLSVRIGDRWSLSKAGTMVLLGEVSGRGEPLMGVLQTVRKSAQGSDWEAIMTVSGRAATPQSEVAVNARLIFTFPPPSAPADPEAAKTPSEEGTLTARGAITELRMALVKNMAVPETNGRLRNIVKQEIVVGRQLTAPGALLTIPNPAPTPNEANSWLLFDDPQGRYHFRHPQDFRPGRQTMPDGNLVELIRPGPDPDSPDRIELQFRIKTGDTAADRALRSPDLLTKEMVERWRMYQADVLRGPVGWLPDAEWAPSKMKVYRINAALKPNGPNAKRAPRLHDDVYLVLFTRDETLVVDGMTAQDPPAPFRKEVETMIKTFQFGPSGKR